MTVTVRPRLLCNKTTTLLLTQAHVLLNNVPRFLVQHHESREAHFALVA